MAENISDKEYFDRNFNISYVDPELPNPDNRTILKHYLCSAFLYGICVVLFWLNSWFSDLMSSNINGVSVKEFLTYVYFLYLVIAPMIYFGFRPRTILVSHNIIICDYFKRIFKQKNKLKAFTIDEIKAQFELYKMSYKEQQSLLLLLIKLFFGTQMLGLAFGNFSIMLNQLPRLTDMIQSFSVSGGNFYYYLCNLSWQFYLAAVNILFLIDLSFFAFAYFTEASFLKNKVRSVDSTPAGILFCLVCYPPFFLATEKYLGSFHGEYALSVFNDPYHWLTVLLHCASLLFLFVYVLATVALGSKASNLTNRGTVSKWPYSVVRHPAYVSKTLFWWCSILPLILVDFQSPHFNILKYLLVSLIIILSMIAWMVVYYFRALTEERHLLKDPEYQEYVKKVKYRFIPGIW